jgi:hypothetical protein
MMMRPFGILALVLIAVCGSPRPAAAWGFDVHRFIMERAIVLLPAEIRPFFQKYEPSIVERAIDPDLWRTVGWTEEPPRHFLDMDAYGPYPFKALPHDHAEAVKGYGAAFVEKNGTLPWRAEEIYKKLVEAFTQKSPYARDNIKLFAPVLAHYCADAHQPFHAALNYDGQLTGQWGIHSRFETELFERYQRRLQLAPALPAPITNSREFMFDTLTASFPYVQAVLDADKAAVAGREFYDDAYFDELFVRVKPVLEKRLSDSIAGVAAIISAAWAEAGRPALPLEAPRTPRRVRRQ